MTHKRMIPIGPGVISCITILLVLLFSVFSCLTLSTAQGDYAMAQRGAETVRSYYASDSAAKGLAYEFVQGTEREMETVIPISDQQGLLVSLLRQPDGTIIVSEWRTVLLEEFEKQEQQLLVWPGDLT